MVDTWPLQRSIPSVPNFGNSDACRVNDRKPVAVSQAIIRIIYKNTHETGHDSASCHEFSLTSFSLSSMYLPDDRLRITTGVEVRRTHLPCISACDSMP